MKHLLWHGNVEEALERVDSLVLDLSLIQARSAPAKKLASGLAEFETYICNNREFIPNFGERYRNGETISTAFVNRPSIRWSANALSSGNRCSGRCAAPIYCCRRGPKS